VKPTYTVYIHSSETTAFVVEATTEDEAYSKAMKRWDDGEDGDIPINTGIDCVDVEKNP
jgi:Ca2+-binding EF-hand superfamily protein